MEVHIWWNPPKRRGGLGESDDFTGALRRKSGPEEGVRCAELVLSSAFTGYVAEYVEARTDTGKYPKWGIALTTFGMCVKKAAAGGRIRAGRLTRVFPGRGPERRQGATIEIA